MAQPHKVVNFQYFLLLIFCTDITVVIFSVYEKASGLGLAIKG